MIAQIIRNDQVLREAPLRLAPGPLVLTAELQGERLMLQVNDATVTFQDLFPLGRNPRGRFALDWPESARLVKLVAERQIPPAKPTLLEQGDQLYALGNLREALNRYREQQQVTPDPRDTQEVRCKEAMCLAALNDAENAAQVFEKLADESGERWPVVAACQLWLLRLRQGRRDEADLVYTNLEAKHPFTQIAALVPADVHLQILSKYSNGDFSFIARDPDYSRDLEFALKIANYLRAPVDQQRWIRFQLATVHFRDEQLEAAEAVLSELLREPSLEPYFESQAVDTYAWLLSRRGRADSAAAELDRRIASNREGLATLWLTRAKLKALSRDWNAAAADLDEFLHRRDPGDRQGLYDACLLRGFALEGRGDAEAARKAWLEGYRAASGTEDMKNLTVNMLASLSGGLTREDAMLTMFGVISATPENEPMMNLFKSSLFDPEDIERGLRTMWSNPRGKEYARRIAVRDISYGDSLTVQIPLASSEVVRWGSFGDDFTEEDDALLWGMSQDLVDAYIHGKIKFSHLIALQNVWMSAGAGGASRWWLFGSKPLSQENRGRAAYFLAHRRLRKNRKAEAQSFFKIALDSATPETSLQRRARAGLERASAP
ncbi:MAG: hypothetical protein U0835_05295 [Isosphaeraceae bacterium]